MRQEADGVFFETREPVNLTWLQPYGRVFYVFDRLTSGNLCLGVEGAFGRLFVKYAGARTLNYTGRTQDAVVTLRTAERIYREFPHPALVPLRAAGPVNGGQGYALFFPWMDMPALRTVPPDGEVLRRVRRLPLTVRLGMLEQVFALHAHLEQNGLTAVGFDDGNVLIDFDGGGAYVCDVDLYRPGPVANPRGRMPGRGAFRAPEEYVPGALIDDRTTVYKMAVLALMLLDGGESGWDAPEGLHRVAMRAAQQERERRYAGVTAFLSAWREAVREDWLY